MIVARSYDASKNPEGTIFDGVPLRDLTQEEFDALPGWLQASVAAAPFYTTVPLPVPDTPAVSAEAGVALDATDSAPSEPAEPTTPRRRRE